jgi:hypothetical protein
MFGLDNSLYQMAKKEQETACQFVCNLKDVLDTETYSKFERLFAHLCNIQNPNNREFPIVDSIIHGVEVAKLCLLKSPKISFTLLLGALGHDWDRACGERRIKATDYANTKEDYWIYKDTHARNSAALFCTMLAEFFDEEIVNTVHSLIVNHEVGGEGDLAILDFADGMAFFISDNLDYYRFHRKYKGEEGEELSPAELEKERQAGFVLKVGFMLDTMSPEDQALVKYYIIKRQKEINPDIKTELNHLLDLGLYKEEGESQN